MSYPHIDILDWNTIQPLVDHLLAAELTAANANAWLQEWSDLTAAIHEAAGQIYRAVSENTADAEACLLYTSPSPRDRTRSRMPSSA